MLKPNRRSMQTVHADEMSWLTATPVGNEDKARQEFKKDADINEMVKRMTVYGHNKQADYLTIDDELDLQTALETIKNVRKGHARLEADLKAKYPTWQSMLTAIESGNYETPAMEKERVAAENSARQALRDAEIAAYLNRQPKATKEE